jgi:hypothetical protein
LFSVPISGTPAAVNLPVQNQGGTITYSWANRLAIDGTLEVLSGANPVDTTPTNITAVTVGNALELSWPGSHTGWRLQAQTNSLNVGISDNWVDVAGSTATNRVFMSLDPANGSVFFRLLYP